MITKQNKAQYRVFFLYCLAKCGINWETVQLEWSQRPFFDTTEKPCLHFGLNGIHWHSKPRESDGFIETRGAISLEGAVTVFVSSPLVASETPCQRRLEFGGHEKPFKYATDKSGNLINPLKQVENVDCMPIEKFYSMNRWMLKV
jgi:hypothetical protein